METEHKHLRELSTGEMEDILRNGYHAHLGCHTWVEGTYVCPVTYVFEEGYVFSHSLMGKKIEMMRANPNVCLQVEEVKSIFNWKSVIIYGRFEELTGGFEAEVGLRLLKKKIAQLEATHKVSELQVQIEAILSRAKIFRIKIVKMTGRAEER